MFWGLIRAIEGLARELAAGREQQRRSTAHLVGSLDTLIEHIDMNAEATDRLADAISALAKSSGEPATAEITIGTRVHE